MMSALDPWLVDHLCCPVDHADLTEQAEQLSCAAGHTYPVVDGIPVLLVVDAPATQPLLWERARSLTTTTAHPLGSPGARHAPGPAVADVDPFVQDQVAATNGLLYKELIGKLPRYPIPESRLPLAAPGATLLDIGCNWGRWCIASARKGYRVVGIDPNLEALFAARRVAAQLGCSVRYLVGDARFLPFKSASFDTVFSYSVPQHFSKPDARQALADVRRVLRPDGGSLIQMPNAWGLRSAYHQRRLRGREQGPFAVRYWTLGELIRTFETAVGPSHLSVDGFFGLGMQASDVDVLPFRYASVVRASEQLRHLSDRVSILTWLADSVYVWSRVRPNAVPVPGRT